MSGKTGHDEKQLEIARKRANRLISIKMGMESGQMKNFEQIFDIIAQTTISAEIRTPYYTFLKKVRDPRQFTLYELMRLAALFGVKYEVIDAFIWGLIKSKFKSRFFPNDIRGIKT